MKHAIEGLAGLIAAVSWLAGIVLAQGWMKAVAIFAPYAWYLVVERAMQMLGWLAC